MQERQVMAAVPIAVLELSANFSDGFAPAMAPPMSGAGRQGQDA
jgi:hypothetical protein